MHYQLDLACTLKFLNTYIIIVANVFACTLSASISVLSE